MIENNKFITFMGTPMDYDTLRAWVKCPYTLEPREREGYKAFIESHHIGLGPFDWFLEYHWSMGQLASSETECLLEFIDKLEWIDYKFTTKATFLCIENHLRYIVKELMDIGDAGPIFFEAFIDQRTSKTELNIDWGKEDDD